jgi:ABC-type cobalamin/Fe3+-siderophores transport system ATPase subunit
MTVAQSQTQVVYRVQDVLFRYSVTRQPDREGTWVLRDLDFEVPSGEVLGIIGPNGSGKTSLLKLLAKLLRPQAGRISLFGSELAALSQEAVARSVALVPQESPPVFPFTIAEVVLMGRFPHRQRGWNFGSFGWEGPDDVKVAREAMDELDVGHLARRSIYEVSGGERQRAIIARALAQEPRVLLLDEPTAFLDLNHQLDICRILRRLNQERGLTVVLVSHDLNLASQYCDRLLMLSEGRVVRIGSPEEVIRPELLEKVYRCEVLVDRHPTTGLPRVTLPGRTSAVIRDV